MFERKSEPTVITNGVIEKEYETLRFASDETFKKAYLILDKCIPIRRRPFETTLNPKYVEYTNKKTINHFLFALMVGVAYSELATNENTPQEAIGNIKKFGSGPYAEEAISLVEDIEKILSGPQENCALFLTKFRKFRDFFRLDAYDSFMLDATRYMASGKPSFTLDAKGLFERLIKTDFDFSSNEGRDILNIWEKVGNNPIVKARFEEDLRQEQEKKLNQKQ